MRSPRHLVLSLLLLATLLAGCGRGATQAPVSTEVAVPAATPPAAGAATPGTSAPAAEPTRLTIFDLQVAYQLLLQQYVDPLDHEQLLKASRKALRDSMLEAGALPLDTLPLDISPTGADDPAQDWAAFAAAYTTIVQKHEDWANTARPDIAVLHAMLDGLGDSHTSYIDADEAKRRADQAYSGIGIRLTKADPKAAATIVEVFDQSPAQSAGVKAGDKLVAVDGTDVVAESLATIADEVRGQDGSTVRLSLKRPGAADQTVDVRRAQLQLSPVEAKMATIEGRSGKVAILRIRSFSEDVPPRAAQVLADMFVRGGAQAIVLDLRGNGGGSLQAVATVAGFFVDIGRPIGVEVDRSRRKTTLNAEGKPIRPLPPMAVLVDSGTASGAEILAVSLKEYGLATLVGEKTAGSVAVSEVQKLSDDSQVQITVHRFLAPSGAQLDKVGVQPDEVVRLTDDDLVKGNDPQLQRAVEIVAQKMAA